MKTTTPHIIKTHHIARVLVGSAALLLVPLIAMLLTDTIRWTFFDFVVAAVLLVSAGLAYDFWSQKARSTQQRVLIAGMVAIVFGIIWVQLAVGIFN